MKEFTKEMLVELTAANDAVRGTPEYTKFHMPCYSKHDSRWSFLCWSIPHTTGFIKTFKGKTYIITESCGAGCNYLVRYEVREEAKKLLGI